MQRVLAAVIAVLMAAGLVSARRIALDERAGGGGGDAGRVTAADGTGPVGVTPGGELAGLRPGPGQTLVRGTVTELTVGTAALPPIPLPFTLEAAERGRGRARIEPATVDGRPGATLVWDSGRPLPVSGPGSLDLSGPALVTVSGGQLRVHLDGAARVMPPGTFELGATVAVGRSGLAQPRDAVRFSTDGTTLQTTGDVFVVVGGPLRLEGPSPLTARGQLTTERPGGEVTEVGGLDFAGGPLVVELAPDGNGGWRLDALLQGTVVAVS